MDRWIQGEPEWEPDEERSEAEAWLEADAADAYWDERWIQEREEAPR